jgi:hypothetical protein
MALEPFLGTLFDRFNLSLEDTSLQLCTAAEPVPGGYPFSVAGAMCVVE